MRDLERLLSGATSFIAPVTVLAALIGGAIAGIAPGLLILASGMLLGAVLLFWSSLGRLTGESPLTLEEAVGLAAPSPEEEKKRSILRALKDLEYERSVGKLSEEDFAELSTRYRTEAKALLRSLEAELAPRRVKAEAKLKARLEKEGIVDGPGRAKSKGAKSAKKKSDGAAESSAETEAGTRAESGAEAGAGAKAESNALAGAGAHLESEGAGERPNEVEPRASERVVSGNGVLEERSATKCPSCQTMNDDDARFCKRCGRTIDTKERDS
ncbi:MAG TPA: zinc-ribbon domain-containing protein [Polyangiaceae bacterium]